MGLVLHPKYHAGLARRIWLAFAVVVAFLLAALWARPIG